jgi:hypothetical protein
MERQYGSFFDEPHKRSGRYAYAIYDEGGLLDANVAGYPFQLCKPNRSPRPHSPTPT